MHERDSHLEIFPYNNKPPASFILHQLGIYQVPTYQPECTLPEANIALENRPSQKKTNNYSNRPFSGANCYFQGVWLTDVNGLEDFSLPSSTINQPFGWGLIFFITGGIHHVCWQSSRSPRSYGRVAQKCQGNTLQETNISPAGLPSLKLTARTWKWMVGRLVSFRGSFLVGAMLVSGSLVFFFSWFPRKSSFFWGWNH